jgi:formylglycine-generating enzyme required for sulfatase activity
MVFLISHHRAFAPLLLLVAFCGPSAAQEQRAARPPQVVSNSIGLQLVRIPAGEFLMGAHEPAEELCKLFAAYERKPEEFSDEYPRHKVQITKPFWLGQCEVTVGQFRKFTDDTGYQTTAETDGKGGWGYDPKTGICSGRFPQFNWHDAGFPQIDDHPVLNVSWYDATAFCEWLSKKENRKYRLPTEAEWEYACRAGTSTRYFHGNDPAELSTVARLMNASANGNYADVQSQVHFLKPGESLTAKVGSHQPNPWGLYDMIGNVWEWTGDWYGEDYYAKSPEKDPPGMPDANVKVRRGGAWNTFPLYARPAYRNWNSRSTRCINLGFRVVREE